MCDDPAARPSTARAAADAAPDGAAGAPAGALRREFGDSFTLRAVPVGEMVFVSDPASIKAVFAADRVNTIAPGRNIVLAPLLGADSLLLLEGERHLSRRKLMLPPFHGERMRAYEEVMRDATEREIGAGRRARRFRLHSSMQEITLEVIMRAVFGVTQRRREDLRRALLDILAATRSPATLGVTMPVVRELPRFRKLQRQVEAADALLAAEIAEHRADPELDQREDILSLLIAARDTEGEGMSDSELRDQLMTLLLAGHETTATALAWAFELLFRHPDALERLRDEVAAGEETRVPGRGDRGDAPPAPRRPLRRARAAPADDPRRPRAAAGDERVPGDLPRAHEPRDLPRALRVPARALPARPRPRPTAGSRSAAAPAAASAPPSRSSRCGWCCGRCSPASSSAAASTEPQPMVRRNVTLSPRDGTPAIVERTLRPEREGALSPT